MARGVNKVIIVGNLGDNPEVRVTQSGTQMANISVATSESWTDKQTGQKHERTEWHRVVFFNRLAEIAGQYLKKGSKVFVEGSLRTRKWQDQQGIDRFTTEIMGNELQMLDSNPNGQNNGQYQQGNGQQYQQQPQQQQNNSQQRPANYGNQGPHAGFESQRPQAQQSPNQNLPHSTQYQQNQNQAPPQQGSGNFDDFDDDIPF